MDESAKLEEIRRLLGMGAEPTGPTFGELWGRYYREEARYLDTARDMERFGRVFAECWGSRPALSLTTADVEAYRDARRLQVTRRGKPPMPATLNRETAAARRCLQWAVEQRII